MTTVQTFEDDDQYLAQCALALRYKTKWEP